MQMLIVSKNRASLTFAELRAKTTASRIAYCEFRSASPCRLLRGIFKMENDVNGAAGGSDVSKVR